MSRTEQELRQLYASTRGMPTGAAKFAVLEEVIRHADALGLVEFAFDVRMSATSVFQHSWAPEKAFLTFSWCLAAYDREPHRFGSGHEHTLLWQFKWMAYSVYQYPEIPLQRGTDLLEDMERRYRRGGHSMHAVLQNRGEAAQFTGEVERAQAYYEEMALTRRDALSDCAGCVPSSQVQTLVALGRDEEAIRIGESAVRSGCTEQPQLIYSELLLPFVRSGLGERAVEAHRAAYRRIRDNPHHLGELALNLLFCVHSGNLVRGLDLIERHLSWLDRPRTPLTEMEFAAAAVAVLSRSQEQNGGDGGAVLRFPTVEGKRRPDTPAAELAVELRERALGIAERFDARNGNTYQSTRIRDWMDTGAIGEPLPLSVFERAANSRGGERLQRLLDQVADRTAAGDLVAAARTRAAAAELMLADEQYAEAAEAAEEAIRELDRLGLTADAAACRWVLARAYRMDGPGGSGVRALRELLDSDPWGREPQDGGPGVSPEAPQRLQPLPLLPARPELEAALGQWLGYGPEAAGWSLAAARGFAAAGREEEALAALGEALARHPDADAEPTDGVLADLLGETGAVLGRLFGEAGAPGRVGERGPTGPTGLTGLAGPADRAVSPTVVVLIAYAEHLQAIGRLEEAAERLRTACALLDAHPDTEAAGRRSTVLTDLGEVLLRLGDVAAAEEFARAALALLEPDDAWEEIVLLGKVLRARGADEELAKLLTEHGLELEDLDD
ncbi:collagen-like protein [Kitasatospora sp. NPDC096128]|uniref:collagen-like protein n=1 Tax=Kitasatospora sp. NPDC096128 TaxID=3155547 RepID=UPI00331A8198